MVIIIVIIIITFEASLVAQRLKQLPAVWETWVRSLGQEDPLEKEMATYSRYFCLENPMDGGAWWATAHRATINKWLQKINGYYNCYYHNYFYHYYDDYITRSVNQLKSNKHSLKTHYVLGAYVRLLFPKMTAPIYMCVSPVSSPGRESERSCLFLLL